MVSHLLYIICRIFSLFTVGRLCGVTVDIVAINERQKLSFPELECECRPCGKIL